MQNININKKTKDNTDYINTATEVINIEVAAINNILQALKNNTDNYSDNFNKACELIITTKNNNGRIIITGVGKSGHIGKKIAASLASLGSPAFFVHAAEAQHGDLGMITTNDLIIALSYSGTSNEIVDLIPSIKNLNIPMIAITGNNQSILARNATIHLPIYITKEACHLNLAPTASTTATLVLGDALTMAVTKAQEFKHEDFARSHPGGNLGRRLLLKVEDIMITANNNYKLPIVSPDTLLSEALITMTNNNQTLGMLAIVNQDNNILGIFTDGDLRRFFNNFDHNMKNISIKEVMNTNYTAVDKNILAVDAWNLMSDKKINGLLVIDENNKLIGMLNVHTLVAARII